MSWCKTMDRDSVSIQLTLTFQKLMHLYLQTISEILDHLVHVEAGTEVSRRGVRINKLQWCLHKNKKLSIMWTSVMPFHCIL